MGKEPSVQHTDRTRHHALKQAVVAGTTGSLLLSAAVVGVATTTTTTTASTSTTAVPTPASRVSLARTAPVAATTSRAGSAKSVKGRMLDREALLRAAAKLKGRPYRYGATGPKAFDCSGYTQYVLRSQKRKLARTAAQQYRQLKKVPKQKAKPGDLVFFRDGGRVSHVGIYAGSNRMWHSPRTGLRVRLIKIYTSNWVAGRVA